MARKLHQWVETDVGRFEEKLAAWLSQCRFFRDPIRPTHSDLGRFSAPSDVILLYQGEMRPEEYILEINGRAGSRRAAVRDGKNRTAVKKETK